MACPWSLKEDRLELLLNSTMSFKMVTWQDEGDEAGCDGHGAKDEGGDDRADLGQRRHRRRQRASHLVAKIAVLFCDLNL